MSEQTIPPVAKPAVPDPTEVERKKRETEIKARGAALKAEKDVLNKQRAEIIAKEKALESEKKEAAEIKRLWDMRLTDPNAFMTKAYNEKWRDTLAKDTAGDTTPLAVQQLREEWEKERKERAAADAKRVDDESKAKEDAEKAAADEEETAFQEYAKDIQTRWIEERKDKYPSLYSARLALEVAKKVREVHKTTGKMPDEDVIAGELEAELDKILEGVYATNKWSEKLAAKFKPPPPVRKTDAPSFTVARKAISQDMAAGTKPPVKPMTREQKREMLAQMPDDEWNKRVQSARTLRASAGGGSEEE